MISVQVYEYSYSSKGLDDGSSKGFFDSSSNGFVFDLFLLPSTNGWKVYINTNSIHPNVGIREINAHFFPINDQKCHGYLMEWRSIGWRRRRGRETGSERSDTLQNGTFIYIDIESPLPVHYTPHCSMSHNNSLKSKSTYLWLSICFDFYLFRVE